MHFFIDGFTYLCSSCNCGKSLYSNGNGGVNTTSKKYVDKWNREWNREKNRKILKMQVTIIGKSYSVDYLSRGEQCFASIDKIREQKKY